MLTDACLYSEESRTNRFQETITLFKTIAEKEAFSKSAFILFLNKFDLFQQKYYRDKIPLNYSQLDLFEDAPKVEDEKDDSCSKAIKWYQQKLVQRVDQEKRNKYYVHITTALDTKNMAIVIDLCAKHVLETHLRSHGFIDYGSESG